MFKVSDKLYRGPRPQDLEKLRLDGFDCIISLQSGFYELLYDDKREEQFPCEFGLAFYNISLSDFTPPTRSQIDLIMSKIRKHKKTYLHCKHGVDRTGFVVACYRVSEQGRPASVAIDEMFKMGFHKLPYLLWVPTLKRMLGGL